jgi:glycosyltransferase involved in cell wall biosynthesis
VPLEAAAAGRLTIATEVGATPELLRHNDTGLLVGPRDPAAVDRWTREIFRRPERFAAMAKAAAADVGLRFTPARHVTIIERAYRQILSRREGRYAFGGKLSSANAGASGA